jgi:hypothetical protein
MKRFGILTCASLVGLMTAAAWGQTPSVDWKFYGGGPSDDGQTVCFYDAKGVTRMPDKHIRVWIKCVLQKELDAVDIQKDYDGKIVELAAQKVVEKYIPPIASVETIDQDQTVTIIGYEQIADVANIEPRARIFYEINCVDKMERELSIFIQGGGKTGFIDKPRDWQYLPPEGNGARLLKILCPP